MISISVQLDKGIATIKLRFSSEIPRGNNLEVKFIAVNNVRLPKLLATELQCIPITTFGSKLD